MTFNVLPKVKRQIENSVENLGYKSESIFCYEFINEYLSKPQYYSIYTYINKLLIQTVDCTIAFCGIKTYRNIGNPYTFYLW